MQRASVARMTPTVNSSDFVIQLCSDFVIQFLFFFFFFLVFSQKQRGRVMRNIGKKSTWPKGHNDLFVSRPASLSIPMRICKKNQALK